MSLICAHCGRIIMQSNNTDDYSICPRCDVSKITPDEEELIREYRTKKSSEIDVKFIPHFKEEI